jgi:conserved oligomeric Golgi complex subunit 1
LRLLKRRVSVLIASKLLTLSRLLHKTLTQQDSPSTLLETLRIRLASLRRILLKRIDHQLSSPKSGVNDVVEGLCAFCLVTSSSPGDVLCHYYHLRYQSIRTAREGRVLRRNDVLRAFEYYLVSVRITFEMLGQPLSRALDALRTQPILDNIHIQDLEELDLSILQGWVAPEIRNFVPFIKHVSLASSEIEAATYEWSRQGFEIFNNVLTHQLLESTGSLEELFAMRKALLDSWLPVDGSSHVHSRLELLSTLRKTMNDRVRSLIEGDLFALRDLASALEVSLNEQTGQKPHLPSIWDEDFVAKVLGKGGTAFTQELKSRHLGLTPALSALSTSLGTWVATVENTRRLVDQLRKDRWLDRIDDETEEEDAAILARLLSSDDPDLYMYFLSQTSENVLSEFQQKIAQATKEIHADSPIHQTIFLIRYIRETYQQLHHAFPDTDLGVLTLVLSPLRSHVSNVISTQLLEAFACPPSSTHNAEFAPALTQLWEGTPPLPTQPSPHTFKLLQTLCMFMADLGADLWTPPAVHDLKRTIGSTIAQHDLLGSAPPLGFAMNGLTNGVASAADDAEHHGVPSAPPNPAAIQRAFDVLYLSHALKANMAEWSALGGLKEEALGGTALGPDGVAVLERRAAGYWTRTRLLFGLLAGDATDSRSR